MENLPFTINSYQHYLQEGKMMGSRCLSCGAVHLPPRAICRRCRSDQMEWVEMPGIGNLATYTAIHIGQSKMAVEGFGRDYPYCVGVVELENGVRISARILGVDARDPMDIQIGTSVTVEFLKREDGEVVLAFRV